MNILNIAFTEIKAKKENPAKGQINISNNVKIVDLKESKINIDDARKTLEVHFDYSTEYKPDLGTVELKGKMIVIDTKEEIDSLVDSWKENKKIPKEKAPAYLNPIMNKSVMQTILLSREIELPSPIPMPSVKQQEN